METCGGYIICSLYTKWHSEVVAGLCSLPNIGGSSEISSRFKVSLDIRNSPTHQLTRILKQGHQGHQGQLNHQGSMLSLELE